MTSDSDWYKIASSLGDRVAVLENTLKWVRFYALLHYMGGAFDPEHMRDIANVAADALALHDRNPEPLPDFEDAFELAQEEGKRLAELFEGYAE